MGQFEEDEDAYWAGYPYDDDAAYEPSATEKPMVFQPTIIVKIPGTMWLKDLRPGETFSYVNGSSAKVYMVIESIDGSPQHVLLNTGKVYTAPGDRNVRRVKITMEVK